MAKTPKFKKAANDNDLNDRQHLFVLEYVKTLDAKKAAIAAGYKERHADVQGAKLMANPLVVRSVGAELHKLHTSKSLTNEMVIQQLVYALTRTSDDFIDEDTGLVVSDLRKLSERGKAMVEGIKQKVKTWTDSEGNVTTEVENDIKFVSKAGAIDLAMRHKGLIQTSNQAQEVKVTVNLNDFLINHSEEAPKDLVEERLRTIEVEANKAVSGQEGGALKSAKAPAKKKAD